MNDSMMFCVSPQRVPMFAQSIWGDTHFSKRDGVPLSPALYWLSPEMMGVTLEAMDRDAAPDPDDPGGRKWGRFLDEPTVISMLRELPVAGVMVLPQAGVQRFQMSSSEGSAGGEEILGWAWHFWKDGTLAISAATPGGMARVVRVGPAGELVEVLYDGRLRKPPALSVPVEWAPDLAFLAYAWTLMQIPTVAEVSTHRPPSKVEAKRRKKGKPPTPDVRVVRMRPLRNEHATHSPSGRRYTHRWLVRGHWRNQACGPKHSERRRTWVPAYTKGPDGAPLIGGDVVNAWVR